MAVRMDKESVTRRLRDVAELSHLCRQLAGPRWPYRLANLPHLLKPADAKDGLDCPVAEVARPAVETLAQK